MDGAALALDICQWLAQNSQAHSRFLYPGANDIPFVYTYPLMDWLSERLSIDKEVLGTWFNTERVRVEQKE